MLWREEWSKFMPVPFTAFVGDYFCRNGDRISVWPMKDRPSTPIAEAAPPFFGSSFEMLFLHANSLSTLYTKCTNL